MRSDHCSICLRPGPGTEAVMTLGPPNFSTPGRDRERMQVLREFVVCDGVADICASQYVERAGLEVDDGRRSDSDFGANEWALHHVF